VPAVWPTSEVDGHVAWNEGARTIADTVIFDVDGTLVDSNYQHTLAWYRAFRRYGIIRPLWRIHRGVGMGGDTFVPEIGGPTVERQLGDALRDAWVEEFDQLIGEVQPFEGAHELLQDVKDRGFRLVLASSGKSQHVERFLDLIDGQSLADAWTTSDDAEHSKPEPDLIVTALRKVGASAGIMVGDSPYDAIAAARRTSQPSPSAPVDSPSRNSPMPAPPPSTTPWSSYATTSATPCSTDPFAY